MRRLLPAALLALTALLSPGLARAQTQEQSLVDRSTLTIQEMMTPQNNPEALKLLKNAKGVMVCPRIFKAGFIIGGSGGGCVLVARTADGGWSNPAFYGMGSGSVGFQIGVQDAELVFIVLTVKGLHALLDSQFKFGADASIAVATIGAGVQGATTAALRADIVAFARARWLYAGISLAGSLISTRSNWNKAYYGQFYSGQQIVLEGQGNNPGAAPLKGMLAQLSK